MGYVYLLHFERPINPERPAQHYLGWASDLARRIEQHARGRRYNSRGGHTGCSRLCEVAHERDNPFQVVRVWEGDRELERRLKGWKQMKRYCPICGRNHRLRGVEELSAEEIEEALLAF